MNKELSKILYEMAEYYEIEGTAFKPQAYTKAAMSIESLALDISEIYRKDGINGLKSISGVGSGIAERIEEYMKRGKIEDYENLKKKFPANVSELTSVDGVGPKLIKLFYDRLKIKDINGLEKAAKKGEIKNLPRCGEKLEKKILKWIEFYKKSVNDSLPEEIFGLPKDNGLGFIEEKDIKGDLHVHSHYNADKEFVNRMIQKAAERGYEYLGISDHTKFLAIEHGLNEKELMEQAELIKKLSSEHKIKIFHGCEANILADGSIDISDDALAKLDYVIAGVHSQMKMPKKEMTERIIKAMENPNVDIISHPTGRIIRQRDEFEIDFDEILKTAKLTGTILEINSNPYRLDLKSSNIKKAKKAGVMMIINSDAHQPEQMDFIKFGIEEARKGGAEKKDILNILPLQKFVEFFKKKKKDR
ncbi:MAG: PHP domain-containing protein [Candidatus Pacebacteria bacterium]|nr:PHP domain-containing protein [Candidatus Paceibacterota bacterium]